MYNNSTNKIFIKTTLNYQTSSYSGLRNDVKAIQNLITIARNFTPISVYNHSPSQNIIKHYKSTYVINKFEAIAV